MLLCSFFPLREIRMSGVMIRVLMFLLSQPITRGLAGRRGGASLSPQHLRQSQENQELCSQCKGYIRPCLRTTGSLSFTALLKGRVSNVPHFGSFLCVPSIQSGLPLAHMSCFTPCPHLHH